MKTDIVRHCHAAAAFTAAFLLLAPLARAEANTCDLYPRLSDSKRSLIEGILQAEQRSGPAISAKFEMKGDVLMLSVYHARAGLAKDAEHNELVEQIGDATRLSWTPETEIFEDKVHLTRSASQLALVQSAKLNLTDAIRKAEAKKAGSVYCASPAARDGHTVYVVKAAAPTGETVELIVDAQTGEVAEHRHS